MKSKRIYLDENDDMEIILKEYGLNFLKNEKRKVPKMKKESKINYKKSKLTSKT